MAAHEIHARLLDCSHHIFAAPQGISSEDFQGIRRSLCHITDMWSSRRRGQASFWSCVDAGEDARASWRKKLGGALETTVVHATIVGLLLIDLLATAIDILKTLQNKSRDLGECVALVEECHCTTHFERSESWEFLYWISITILSILALNVLGLLLAFGVSFFKHPGYVLDLVVVITALCLELLLDAETASLLVVLNLWRIVRVAHGIFEVTDEAWEKEIHELELQIETVEAAQKEDVELLRRKDEQIAELEKQLKLVGNSASDVSGSYF
eukprot:c24365_g1_i1 orf=143-952(+)